jgi:ribosomal-protein-serine acetyltransferase
MGMLGHCFDTNLWLELLRPYHAAALFAAIDSDRDRLRIYLPWVDQTRSEEDSVAFIKGSLEKLAADRSLELGIFSETRVAGVIGLRGLSDPNRQAEIGYWLHGAFEGRGIMTRACRAVIDHAFGDLGLNRIRILCATDNLRSQGIPQRLGFQREGLVREAEKLTDRFADLIIYGMLAREWTAGKQRD